MTTGEYTSFEDALIEDMRAHDGQVTSGPLAGHPLLVMWSTGAKSGERRRSILTYSREGDAYVVAGTAGGSTKDPAWIANLTADPNVTLEIANRTFEATAEVIVNGADRDRLWDAHVEALPNFAAYPEQSGRLIPMVRLAPVVDPA